MQVLNLKVSMSNVEVIFGKQVKIRTSFQVKTAYSLKIKTKRCMSEET